jgi:sialate O-acetylesterase
MVGIKYIAAIFIVLVAESIYAQRVKMPAFFSSDMVLQRQKPITFWGTAPAKASFAVTFNGKKQKVKANATGEWSAVYPALEAGGPYTFTVHTDSSYTFTNIAMGDVWICSGQSNMEWPVLRTFNASYELRHANYPEIRSFTVTRKVSSYPLKDTEPAQWKVCTPAEAASFTAVGYFFARTLHEELNIPIGIIHTSWGGTAIASWTSLDALYQHPDFRGKVDTFRLTRVQDRSVENLEKKNVDASLQWWNALEKKDPGLSERWYSEPTSGGGWKKFIAPDFGTDHAFANYAGSLWLRKTFNLSAEVATRDLVLNLEILNDMDITYCNGVEIGRSIWAPSRRIYTIPKNLLKGGTNTFVIRLEHQAGNGCFKTHTAGDLRLFELAESDNPIAIPLAGEWEYKTGLLTKDYPVKTPTIGLAGNIAVLYNAMIAPFTRLGIKGFTWYQGEGNSGKAYQYRSLLPLLINDWRKQFRQGDLPFMIVQISGFGKLTEEPVDNTWAELREAQAMALSMSNTGLAVSHDVGDPYDVHPTQKQVVGKRLAQEALKVAYGKSDLYTSPRYKSSEKSGDTIIIHFTNIGKGLQSRGAQVKGFAIAAADKKFVWAEAIIKDATVRVWSKKIQNPVAVRYAWAGSPVESNGANVYSIEGFPVMSFRTDSWEGVTLNKK